MNRSYPTAALRKETHWLSDERFHGSNIPLAVSSFQFRVVRVSIGFYLARNWTNEITAQEKIAPRAKRNDYYRAPIASLTTTTRFFLLASGHMIEMKERIQPLARRKEENEWPSEAYL